MSQIARMLRDEDMPLDEYPEEDDVRQSYNVAPGYHEAVYREYESQDEGESTNEQTEASVADLEVTAKETSITLESSASEENIKRHYKIQSMKWGSCFLHLLSLWLSLLGLVPFWTKRNPDYKSLLKTINCRNDSLIDDRGMWTSMKKKKRCIILAQGFFEWQKLDGGRQKVPHFVKRKDGKLMCMAGLWDAVKYEGLCQLILFEFYLS
jgi:putative SOS response-associated peptidase YedK